MWADERYSLTHTGGLASPGCPAPVGTVFPNHHVITTHDFFDFMADQYESFVRAGSIAVTLIQSDILMEGQDVFLSTHLKPWRMGERVNVSGSWLIDRNLKLIMGLSMSKPWSQCISRGQWREKGNLCCAGVLVPHRPGSSLHQPPCDNSLHVPFWWSGYWTGCRGCVLVITSNLLTTTTTESPHYQSSSSKISS